MTLRLIATSVVAAAAAAFIAGCASAPPVTPQPLATAHDAEGEQRDAGAVASELVLFDEPDSGLDPIVPGAWAAWAKAARDEATATSANAAPTAKRRNSIP